MARPMSRSLWCASLAALLPAGCIQDAWNDWSALTVAEPSTGAVFSTSTGAPEVEPTGAIQTVTSAAGTTGTGLDPGPVETTGAPGSENAPPTITSFFIVPPTSISEAGPAVLELVTSEDVVKVHLQLNGELLAELTPADFPYIYEVLSAKQNFKHEFTVVVEDEEGLSASSEPAVLFVKVPEPGAEKCLFVDEAALSSWISGLVYAHDAIVAVGTRDVGEGPRLTVWKLDRDQCGTVLAGWPKTMANWTGVDGLGKLMSGGTAIALDEDGYIVIGGFTLVDLKPRRYIAMLNPGGSGVWEVQGQVGEEIAGVAVAPKPKAKVFAVGWRRSGVDPTPTDAMIWYHMPDDGTPSPAEILAAPFTPDEPPDPKNSRIESARAVVIEPSTGYAFIVGEREFMPQDNTVHTRTFAVRVNPLIGVVGEPWTSPGDSFYHDAASAVAICGNELLAGGWRRDESLNAPPAPLLQWFLPGVSADGLRTFPLSSTRLHGVACDREGKVVSAGARDIGKKDARVFATRKEDDAILWYETGSANDDEAASISCDRRGFCAWGGYRTIDAKKVAVVRAHHP